MVTTLRFYPDYFFCDKTKVRVSFFTFLNTDSTTELFPRGMLLSSPLTIYLHPSLLSLPLDLVGHSRCLKSYLLSLFESYNPCIYVSSRYRSFFHIKLSSRYDRFIYLCFCLVLFVPYVLSYYRGVSYDSSALSSVSTTYTLRHVAYIDRHAYITKLDRLFSFLFLTQSLTFRIAEDEIYLDTVLYRDDLKRFSEMLQDPFLEVLEYQQIPLLYKVRLLLRCRLL